LIYNFFIRNSVFLMLGIIIRNNFLEVKSTYSQFFMGVFHALCFIIMYLIIRYMVQVVAARYPLAGIREKENYSRRDIISFLMSERFSVFSCLIYLIRYIQDNKSPPIL
jgi:hypothetical protein